MSERSRKHSIAANSKRKFQKFQESDDESSTSSKSSSVSSESESDGQDFVTGDYADDYEPTTHKQQTKEKTKSEKRLIELLQNAPKPTKVRQQKIDDDTQVQEFLKLDWGDEDDGDEITRRRQKRRQRQRKVSFVPDNQQTVTVKPDKVPETKKVEPEIKKEVQVEKEVEVKTEAEVERKIEKPVEQEIRKVVVPVDFEIERVSGEGLDLTAPSQGLEQGHLDVEENGSMDVFLFHVHEEENRLFLFCKYERENKWATMCAVIPLVYYHLQFLPNEGQEQVTIDEIKAVAKKCGGGCVDAQVQRMKYCFDDLTISRDTEWICAKLLPSTRLAEIPLSGKSYSRVFGLTATLTENFYVQTDIMGPSWIRLNHIQKSGSVATVPMVTVKLVDYVEKLELKEAKIPLFNICGMSIRSSYNDARKKNEIFMIGMRFLPRLDIETFDTKAQQSHMCFACPTSSTSLSSEYRREVEMKGWKHIVLCRNEKELLERFVEKLQEMDIDMIASYGLTTFDLPLICEKLHEHNVTKFWQIGRLQRRREQRRPKFDVITGGRLPVDLRVSCGEFWKSKANDFSSIVKGILGSDRQQLEQFNLVTKLADRNSLDNLVQYTLRDAILVMKLLKQLQILPLTLQISTLSGCPWIRVLKGQASHRCESLLLHRFSSLGYIIPDRQKVSGPFKREAKFEGGMVFEPKRGFYETCICVLDYNSLYPSIIREFNICFTTVDRTNPNAEDSKQKRAKGLEGILPVIMETLLNARKTVKEDLAKAESALGKATSEDKRVELEMEKIRLDIKQKAIKLLANSMYGYLGFKNSRFQANHLASLITQCGRKIIQATKAYVEDQQYDVIYGDTDSVMVNTMTQNHSDAEKIAKKLAQEISKKYRFLTLSLDFVFQKMLLVQKKKYAASLYVSPDVQEIQVKGLDMVRRDWSELTKKLSGFMIEKFLSDEHDTAIERVMNELKIVSSMMRNNGEVDEDNRSKLFPNGIGVNEFVIRKALKRPLSEYPASDPSPHVAVARSRAERGETIPTNATIDYVIIKSSDHELNKRARIPIEVSQVSECDVDWYLLNQLFHPLWRLCEPFGQILPVQLRDSLGIRHESVEAVNEYIPSTRWEHKEYMFYECKGCHARNSIVETTKNFVCPKCHFENRPKAVCNQVMQYIRDSLTGIDDPQLKLFRCDAHLCTYKTNQLPVHSESLQHLNLYKDKETNCRGKLVPIMNTVKSYRLLQEYDDQISKFDLDKDFREPLQKFIRSLQTNHSFFRLSFPSLFGISRPDE